MTIKLRTSRPPSLDLRALKRALLTVTIILASVCVSPWSARVNATTLQPLTLGQMTRLSHLIAQGVVLTKRVIEDDQGSIWSVYRIKLQQVWRGAYRAQETIELTLRGGVLGEGVTLRGQEIPGQPQLSAGQEGVFFLERSARGQLVFTGMSQGWFEISERDGAEWVSRDLEHRAHLMRAPRAVQFAGAEVNLDSLPLAKLRALVKQGASAPRALIRERPRRRLLRTTGGDR